MNRVILVLVSAVLLLALLVGCAAPSAPVQSRKLSIATGGTGGVYYPYGGGIAKVIQKYIPNTEATAEVTAASVDNLKLINDRKGDLAIVMADVAYTALEGTEKFQSVGKVPARSLAVLYTNYMHVIASKESGIKTVADLKGKRVSTGAPGSGTEVKALRVLEAYGIDADKDIQRERLGVAESAGALKDRKMDAFFWDGGLPTAAVLDLGATPGVSIVVIPHGDAISKMTQKYGPVYFDIKIPKGTYGGQDADVPVAGVANLLVAHEKMEESLAYNIVKAMFDHKDELVAVHKEAENLKLESAVVGSSVPFHPGAIKFYKEKGVWKE